MLIEISKDYLEELLSVPKGLGISSVARKGDGSFVFILKTEGGD